MDDWDCVTDPGCPSSYDENVLSDTLFAEASAVNNSRVFAFVSFDPSTCTFHYFSVTCTTDG